MCCLSVQRGGARLGEISLSVCVCVSSLQSSAAASGQIDLQPNQPRREMFPKTFRSGYGSGTQFHFVVLINDCGALQQFPPQNEHRNESWVNWKRNGKRNTAEKAQEDRQRDEEADEVEDTCKQRIPLVIPIPILIPIPIARESAFTLPAMSSRSLLFLANVRVVSSASFSLLFLLCVSTILQKKLSNSVTLPRTERGLSAFCFNHFISLAADPLTAHCVKDQLGNSAATGLLIISYCIY